MVVFEQSGYIRSKVVVFGILVVFGEKWLYTGKGGVFWQKWLYSGKWLYFSKVVVLGYTSCIFSKTGFIRTKWMCSAKVVVFGQSGCVRVKVVVFGQSGCVWAKVVVFGQKLFYSGKWF